MKSVRMICLLALVLVFAQSSFADQELPLDDKGAVPVEQVKGYTAPVLLDGIRPARMAINHREIEGYITFELIVNQEGRVEEARVLYRTSKLAIRNAIDAVARWRFEPAKIDGIPVRVLVAYNVPMGPVLEIFEEQTFQSKVFDESLGMK